jgi:DNA-binding transcriptional ArsR family regulator
MIAATDLAALAHPARRAALAAIATGPCSADDIAKQRGTVAYHVRKLYELGLIEPDHDQRVRGAVKHVYRLAAVNGLADDVAALAASLDRLAVVLAASRGQR